MTSRAVLRDPLAYITVAAVALAVWLQFRDPRHLLTTAEIATVRRGAEIYAKNFDMVIVSIPPVDSDYDGYATAVMQDKKTGLHVDLACAYAAESGCRLRAAPAPAGEVDGR